MIKIENIHVGYDKHMVIKGVNVELESEITTIIGPNGCGKSTLLKAMSKNLKYTSGEVYIDKANLKSMQTKQLAKKLAMLPQNPKAPSDFTVFDLVSYGRYPFLSFTGKLKKIDYQVIEWALEKTDITDLKNRIVSSLSGGERQRAWIAMALAQQPKILLLDEPTTHLDIAHQFEILELIKEIQINTGMMIIMVLHDINQAARYSDQIVVMKEGEIIGKGKPVEIIHQDMMKKVFRLEGEFFHHKEYPYFVPEKSAKQK